MAGLVGFESRLGLAKPLGGDYTQISVSWSETGMRVAGRALSGGVPGHFQVAWVRGRAPGKACPHRKRGDCRGRAPGQASVALPLCPQTEGQRGLQGWVWLSMQGAFLPGHGRLTTRYHGHTKWR